MLSLPRSYRRKQSDFAQESSDSLVRCRHELRREIHFCRTERLRQQALAGSVRGSVRGEGVKFYEALRSIYEEQLEACDKEIAARGLEKL